MCRRRAGAAPLLTPDDLRSGGCTVVYVVARPCHGAAASLGRGGLASSRAGAVRWRRRGLSRPGALASLYLSRWVRRRAGRGWFHQLPGLIHGSLREHGRLFLLQVL